MLPFAAAHIRFLLHTARPDTVHSLLREFSEYGTHQAILLLQAFLLQDDFRDGNFGIKQSLLSEVINFFMHQPNFTTIICEAFLDGSVDGPFLKHISDSLHFSVLEKIIVGLALSDSLNSDLRIQGQNFCIHQIEELCANHDAIALDEKVHSILMFLHQSQAFSKSADSFMKMLSLVTLRKGNPCIFSPWLASIQSLRQLDRFYDSCDNDFDTVLADIEKELSLADIMKEIGYKWTMSESICKSILSIFSPLNEPSLSRILSTIAQTHTSLDCSQNVHSHCPIGIGKESISDSSNSLFWNMDVLVASINQIAPKINWISVLENLDHEGFYIPNERAFSLLISVYRSACQDAFPLHVVCGSIWKNVEGQLSFLRYAVSASPEVFTFTHSTKKLSDLCSQFESSTLLCNANGAWLCLELMDTLCQLAERGYADSVREIIESSIQQYPDTILIGLAHIDTEFNFLQREMSSLVLPIVLGSSTRNSTLKILWNVNPLLLLCGLMTVHVSDPKIMIIILELCLNLKILSSVLDKAAFLFSIKLAAMASKRKVIDFYKWFLFLGTQILSSVLDKAAFLFSIKLAAMASKRKVVDFYKWLIENLNSHGDVFYEECLKFWREISPFVENISCANGTSVESIYAESSDTLVKVLFGASEDSFSDQLVKKMKQFHNTYGSVDSMSFECVEKTANAYFHQIFFEELPVDAVIGMLFYFKDSHVKRKKSILACMVENILNEYRFFPRYPRNQLKIAAVLFGSIINRQFVEGITLSRALQNVLDALCEPDNFKMFFFGVVALKQFVDHLFEWPQYRRRILQISHLSRSEPELVSLIESSSTSVWNQGEATAAENSPLSENRKKFQSRSCEVASENVFVPDKVHLKHRYLSESRNEIPALSCYAKPLASTSDDSTAIILKVPSLDVQEKTNLITNNVTSLNAATQAESFTKIVEKQYFPWFAQVMVKRASTEPSQHDTYLAFLEVVGSAVLNIEILNATYASCKDILRSEKQKLSEDRSLLSNLGIWLGKFTIGKNRVLRARELDLKLLIKEAYEKGLMFEVIPFILKILEACQYSLAYRLPNPWTMGILQLLAEVSCLPNLKTMLAINIEVLFQKLGLDIKEVRSSALLLDCQCKTKGNSDFFPTSTPKEQVIAIFDKWSQICEDPSASASQRRFMLNLQQSGFLTGDDRAYQFFFYLMEHSVASCLRTQEVDSSYFSFGSIHLYAKLILSVFKFCVSKKTSTGTLLLQKISSVVVIFIQRVADQQQSNFHPAPYFRLLIHLLNDLDSLASSNAKFSNQIMETFGNIFYELRPLRVPSFSFAWLELMNHKGFMPKLLEKRIDWHFLRILLVELLEFMEPYLRSTELQASVQHMYHETCKLLHALLDYPDFLSYCHHSFCDVVPTSCIKLRNIIILSAIPQQLKNTMDSIIQTKVSPTPLAHIKSQLFLSENEAVLAGTRYNVPRINSLVHYLGIQEIIQIRRIGTQVSPKGYQDIYNKSATMLIYRLLRNNFDSEGSYVVLNAFVNQLRYDDHCTTYFAFLLNELLREANQDVNQQILRIFLERLLGDQPVPWGVKSTFRQLTQLRDPHIFVDIFGDDRILILGAFQSAWSKCNDL